MFLRWVYKSWKFFWRFILSIVLVTIVLTGVVIGLLQLDVTQNYLANRIERYVERKYTAELSIGEIDGFVPFGLSLKNITLTEKDSLNADTLASIKTINADIALWGLLQNRIRISGFSIDHPRIWLRGENGFSLIKKSLQDRQASAKATDEAWFNTVEVIAPTVKITDGAVYISSYSGGRGATALPDSFSFAHIDAEFFLEWRDAQRYLNIESFSAETPGLKMQNISFSGQIYSEQRLLEFNSFLLNIDDSEIVLNGEIDGVGLKQPDFTEQLLSASYNIDLYSDQFFPDDFAYVIPNSVGIEGPLFFQFHAEGSTDFLAIEQAMVGLGESFIEMNGSLQDLQNRESLQYQFQIAEINLEKPELHTLFSSLNDSQINALDHLTAKGTVHGKLDSAQINTSFTSPLGQLSFHGWSRLQEPYSYSGSLDGQNIDLSSLSAKLDTTSLNFVAEVNGRGFSLDDAKADFIATFTNSRVDKLTFDKLALTVSLDDGFLEQQYEYYNKDKFIKGSGWVDFSREIPPLSMRGNAQNINLAKLFGESAVASTKLNFDYNVEIRGLTLNNIQGRANLDIKPSVIGGDSVRAHQIYMDLNAPKEDIRTFRLTSSLLDMNISGKLVPGSIIDQARYWSAYLSHRFNAEILMNTSPNLATGSTLKADKNMVFNGSITTKDLGLIRKYVPDFPKVQAASSITFNVNTDGRRLLLSAEAQIDSLQYDQWKFKDARTQLTASFRSDRTLKEFSSIDMQAQLGSVQIETVNLSGVDVDFSLKEDAVFYAQEINSVSQNARFNIELSSRLADSSVTVSIEDFFLGNGQYSWVNRQTPSFVYKRDGSIVFNNFRFQNQDEYFRLNGTLSSDRSDSLRYVIRDVHLERISELINGRISFAGILNGTFVTRSLTKQPTVQGEISVNRFALDDRLVGDVSFSSRYNAQKERFDTQIGVLIDSTKYADYLTTNDGVGQNIILDGYFITPQPDVQQDSLFYFDADFRQIDMWVIPLLLENIFNEMEGQSSGQGYITGNFNYVDFHAEFDARNVYAKPRFANTNLFVNGHVIVDRQQGVILDTLNVIDTKGGSGRVWGTIDLNDFKPITYLDLTLDMDRLQFLNSKFDPDIPFYGNVSGTGLVRLSGSNTDLYLRTENPVQLTTNSEISIPLLEETELNKTGKFIRFVDSFEEELNTPAEGGSVAEQTMDEDMLEAAIESMTFSERFDLDLQFVAPNDVMVHLIFDPVTGEVLTARGTGQLRITLQNQNVQMFGQYVINSGSYQFVTGEIISRELELMPGGTISWQGEPDNARLDISAVYHARPNIATLTSNEPLGEENQPNQSVPVDLIVEINGTLNSVENNYYFQLPTSMDLSSNSTLSYTINQINRDEQQKLLQATSILFTGEFIPSGPGNATALGESLSRSSTVLNPLISNQVISPLLSNQINALLNSDVSRLDVDFNLNAYNEVDLGIALRLYNDRLVLRREGRITGGAESTLSDRIGDLNATYRIQQGLSLTAFHRQDQVLSSLGGQSSQSGNVAPDINGVGLEAQVHFNTWQKLMKRIGNFFESIFGSNEEEQENKIGKNKLAIQKAVREE